MEAFSFLLYILNRYIGQRSLYINSNLLKKGENTMLKALKNQRGLTLIELLVVVVILGIIAAIAVPSIGGIINNSKRDAHIANANQMISAARLQVTADGGITVTTTYTMDDLVTNGYLESVPTAPDEAYDKDESKVVVTVPSTGDNLTYTVTLAKDATNFFIKEQSQAGLTRTNVNLVAAP